MRSSTARRASTPPRLPIQAWLMPRSRSSVATASPGLVCPPVPPPAMTIVTLRLLEVPLQGEVDETLHELRIGQPGGLPHACVAARRGEARDRVDLVHQDAAALQEEVHPRHAGAVDGAERRHR